MVQELFILSYFNSHPDFVIPLKFVMSHLSLLHKVISAVPKVLGQAHVTGPGL